MELFYWKLYPIVVEQAPVFTGNYMINNGIVQVDIYGWAFTEVTFSHIPDIQTST